MMSLWEQRDGGKYKCLQAVQTKICVCRITMKETDAHTPLITLALLFNYICLLCVWQCVCVCVPVLSLSFISEPLNPLLGFRVDQYKPFPCKEEKQREGEMEKELLS